MVAVTALFFAANAHPQSVPALVNYQGRLTDQTGNPLSAGAYTLQFNLWDAGTSGNLIWNQQQSVAVQSNGLFNVILGAPSGTSPIPGTTPAVNNLAYAFAGGNTYLGLTVTFSNGVTIPSPSEIVPRQQLLTAPYAFVASTAANATSAASANTATTAANGVPPGTILPYGGNSLPSGFLWCNGNSYPTSAYPALFNAIQYNYGGSGSTFSVPNLNGRFPVGVGFASLGASGGATTINLSHRHETPYNNWPDANGTASVFGTLSTLSSSDDDRHTTGDNYTYYAGNTAQSILPPYIVVNYIIKQ